MFEILKDYHLTNPHKIKNKISALDSDSLQNMLSELQRHYDRTLKSKISTLRSDEGLNIIEFPNLGYDNFSKRLSLYADKIILRDPIYDLLSSLKIGFKLDYVKSQLTEEIKKILDTKDLIDSGLILYIPFNRVLSNVQKTLTQTATNDSSNSKFRDLCIKNMIIGIDEGQTNDIDYSFVFLQLGLSFPRSFSTEIRFKGLKQGPVSAGLIMRPGETFKLRTPSGIVELLPKKLPIAEIESNIEVKNIVEQKIFGQAKEIASTQYMSNLFNAIPIINFEVMWKLINLKYNRIDRKSKTLSALLDLDLKFLDNVETKDILKIKQKEGSVFEDFRLCLKNYCKDIQSLPATKDFEKEVTEMKAERIDPQLRTLDRTFDRIKRYRGKKGLAIGLGTLAGAAFQPIAIPAVLGGVAALLKEYSDFEKEKDKLKENPLYFLWKVKSRAKN